MGVFEYDVETDLGPVYLKTTAHHEVLGIDAWIEHHRAAVAAELGVEVDTPVSFHSIAYEGRNVFDSGSGGR